VEYLIGDGKILRTELDFLVESVRTMRKIRETQGLTAAEAFQKKMEEYFRLNSDMRKTFVYDDILRLADIEAGTSSPRSDNVLKSVHEMRSGDRFEIDGRICLFVRHMRPNGLDLRDGFFEYQYEGASSYYPLDYNAAWTMITEGRMTIG
jgi:hypothetical protein